MFYITPVELDLNGNPTLGDRLPISEDSSLTLQCDYKLSQPTNSPRAMSGLAYRQQSHAPILTVSVSGSGWKPSIISKINTTQLYIIECTSPMLAVTFPDIEAMRTDIPYLNKTMEVRDNIMMSWDEWEFYYPETSPGVPNSNKPSLQAEYYLYFPRLYVYANNPSSSSDASGNYHWSVDFVSRSVYIGY